MSCIASRAILLSGIVTPEMSRAVTLYIYLEATGNEIAYFHDSRRERIKRTLESVSASGGPSYRREGKSMSRVIRAGSLGFLSAFALGVSPGLAQNVEQVKPVFKHLIPNVEGKRMVAVVVSYPPGAKSPAHHHARSAFIYAYVLSGAIRSQVGDEPAKVYRAGEGFYEVPGSYHRISENASDTKAASLLAVFVVDSNDDPLTTPDPK
jgi:quercetin dioxygenase-like cupin family protein